MHACVCVCVYACMHLSLTFLPVLSLCSSRSEDVLSVVYSVSAAVPAPQQLGEEERGREEEGREGRREEGGRERGGGEGRRKVGKRGI